MAELKTIEAYFLDLQDRICAGLAKADGSRDFREDKWERPGGGGGRSRVIEGGKVIEKGGVNFSHVYGELPDSAARALEIERGAPFHATGVSLVIHPRSPKVPIVHMNVRYFELENGARHWFGGGIDLTPIYVVEEDAIAFHRVLKAACDPFGAEHYPTYKAWCDRYFYNRHRKQARGIGGIFFDHLEAKTNEEKAQNFAFTRSVGDAFLDAYVPIVEGHRDESYSEREKFFQLVRRSRYAEFNLVYDRGTRFGLETAGRIESILMSMPPEASWPYNYQPEPNSPEARTYAMLQARDWLSTVQSEA